MLVSNRKSQVSEERAHTSKGQKEKRGSNLGHPKRLLLVSEPKIQPHHKKGKVGHPCSLCFTQGFRFPPPGVYWKRRGGES